MNELALFSGAGGGILGGHLLGWRTVCAVEFEPYAASVLAARQNDGILPPFPIWDDVRTFDGRPWRGLVDVVSGGFPCQDISAAGNGAGIDGERSGLWREMARIVGEVRPRFVFVENSPLLVRRGLAVVLGDLTELGYDARWCVMGAADVGAPHQRDRIWIVANASSGRRSEPSRWQVEQPRRTEAECTGEAMACPSSPRLPRTRSQPDGEDWQQGWRMPSSSRRWPVEPNVGRVANGVASRVDRIKALGNGQVPRVAATAFTYLASEWI
ncbi:DNA cytosine methyltransferase [Pseudomonas aeruginosa]